MNNNRRKMGGGLLGVILLLVLGKVLMAALPVLAVGLIVVGILGAIAIMVLVVVLIISTMKGNENAGPRKTNADELRINPKSGENTLKLKEANSILMEAVMTCSRIEDESIKASARRALGSAEKIISVLKKQQEEIGKCHQFFNYYLPTLNAVLKKYRTIEDSGANIAQTRNHIMSYLSDIEKALTKQYENLFESEKLDLSVEMEAMQNAFKRDGLLEEADIPKPEKEPIQLVH